MVNMVSGYKDILWFEQLILLASAQIAFTLVPKQLRGSRAGLLPPLRTFDILRRNDCSAVLLTHS